MSVRTLDLLDHHGMLNDLKLFQMITFMVFQMNVGSDARHQSICSMMANHFQLQK